MFKRWKQGRERPCTSFCVAIIHYDYGYLGNLANYTRRRSKIAPGMVVFVVLLMIFYRICSINVGCVALDTDEERRQRLTR